MKSTTTSRSAKLFFALSAILGGILAIVWFPNTAGSESPIWGKVTSAIMLWGMSTFLMIVFLQSLIWLYQSRKRIFDVLRSPYSWSTAILFVILSAIPWLILALTYWSESGVAFLGLYAVLCFIPILIIGLVAAANLSPRLDFLVLIKLLIGSGIVWIAVIALIHGFTAIFFEPYIFTYPSRDELLQFSIYFWLVFLAVWYLWSSGIKLSEKLPSQIRQFIIKVINYRPDTNFIFMSLLITLFFPYFVMVMDSYYDYVVSTFGVWFKFTEFDKTAWRYILGTIPLIIGIVLLTFLCISTAKLFFQPSIAKKITANSTLSGFVAVLWIFVLWWIFFASITTHLNFLSSSEYVLASNIQKPTFYDFFFYVFGALTTTDLGDIKAIGNNARWLSVWITSTGIILMIVLAEIVGITFSKNFFSSSEKDEQQESK